MDLFIIGILMFGTAMMMGYVAVMCLIISFLIDAIFKWDIWSFLFALFFFLFLGGIGMFIVGIVVG